LRTAYGWDGLDDPLQLASPDTGTTKRTFDAAGNVATSTDAGGKTTTYSYDALNRRTRAVYADGTGTAWQYDLGPNGIGRLSKITDVTGSTSYSYDANGHVTQKRQIIGALTLTTTYGYDAGGRLASITYPSGKQALYAFDAAGRISGVTVNGQTLVSGVSYFPFGSAAGWQTGNRATYARTFDTDGRISGLRLPASDTLGLAYDAASRITNISESGLPVKGFGYDPLDRVTAYVSGALTQTYAYDADSNRTHFTLRSGATNISDAYTYDRVSNRLLAITGGDSFTYDAAGNMLTHVSPVGDFRYQYDARNRLTLSYSGALATTELVNGLGQRVGRIGEDQPLYFDYDKAGHLLGQYSPGGTQTQETVWLGDLPVGVLQPTGQFYVAPDYLSAPHQITNAAGQVVWHWDHDPFGVGDPTVTGGFTYNVRFPGQFNDQRAKLNYNYFRDYDPRTGLRSAPEVDIGWCEIVQAFVVTAVIIVVDETADLGLKLAWKIVVFQHDAVF
jgi:YD repeat-containing protein